MARVNHKKVKQLLNEKRSKITDRQFFTSRILAGHFEDMAMAQTRRYKYNRRIHVSICWEPKSGEVACTDNLFVRINAGHKLVTKNKGRENRYEIICGQCLHATGLRFVHPRTGQVVELHCPLPEEFTRMLEKLEKRQ